MDPNENLRRQRDLAAEIVRLNINPDYSKRARDARVLEAADELADLVLALDAWLTTGGFLPRAWERK